MNLVDKTFSKHARCLHNGIWLHRQRSSIHISFCGQMVLYIVYRWISKNCSFISWYSVILIASFKRWSNVCMLTLSGSFNERSILYSKKATTFMECRSFFQYWKQISRSFFNLKTNWWWLFENLWSAGIGDVQPLNDLLKCSFKFQEKKTTANRRCRRGIQSLHRDSKDLQSNHSTPTPF